MSVRVGLADAGDDRVLKAASRIAGAGGVTPVLVGAGAADVVPGTQRLTPLPDESDVECLARVLASSDMVAGVAGALTTTADVLRAGLAWLRTAEFASASFAVQHGPRWMTYADCAVVPDPSAEQLAQLAADAADHHRSVFAVEPRVAMLSFSTGGSSTHPRVAKVQQATRLLCDVRPELVVDGEIQFDVAVDPDVAARKAPDSPVAGNANVLVFPSLEAANIAYKVAERVAGARALGSFVLGLRRPWVDLSRGCSTDDIVDTVSLLAGSMRDGDSPRTTAGEAMPPGKGTTVV